MQNAIKRKSSLFFVISFILISILSNSSFINCVNAKEQTVNPDGYVYEFGEDNEYTVPDDTSSATKENGTNVIGDFSINGDIETISGSESNLYVVKDGSVSFSYSFDSSILNKADDEWHIVEDKDKKINGKKYDDNISNGAIVIETSLDGKKWVEDKVLFDVFTSNSNLSGPIYTSKDIQLDNGCYYRFTVVYKMEKRVDDSKVLFVTKKNYDKKKVAERYIVSLISDAALNGDTAQPDAEPHKDLGSKTYTGKDNGYSGKEAIDKDNPHYGWDLGTFFVNGYTRETTDSNNNPIFLKNVGDRVTLWFNLKQDINKLNGNENIVIAEDENGYDQYFETDQTNFKQGALIIKFTDYQGKAEKVLYTNYLAANATTGADTRVQLFEEGDYEVALNYCICDKKGINSYYDYRIFFKFSIRNGNCMVFPFDVNTNAELKDNAITENGFKLDMAKSRYLTIDVQKSDITKNSDGTYSIDERFNRPAKDSDSYTDEGIYTFTVKNLYTDSEPTTKTIYVGNNKALKALSKNNITLESLNSKIRDGYEIGTDGSLIAPPEPEADEETTLNTITEKVTEEKITESADTTEEIVDDTNVNGTETATQSEASSEKPIENANGKDIVGLVKSNKYIVIGAVAFVFIVTLIIIISKKKSDK